MSSSPQKLTLQQFPNKKADARQHSKAKIIPCASSEASDGKGYLDRQGMSAMPLTFCAVSQTDVKVPLRLLCYGDSLTAGFFDNGQRFEPYGRTLTKMLRTLGVPCEVLVCGLSGLTAQEMLTKANKQVLSDVAGCQGKGLHRILHDIEHFDAVLIMAGTNDLSCGNRAESIFELVRSLHSVCHACKIPTVALAPPSAKIAPLTWQQERHKLCHLLVEWASSCPWVVQATDVSEIVPIEGTERTNARLSLWDSDGLHFSPAGSQLLGAALAHKIKESPLQDNVRIRMG